MKQPESTIKPALFIGIDWADQKHDVYTIDADGNGEHQVVDAAPEAIEAWVVQAKARAGDAPIAIALEQSRGPLAYALMFREGVNLFPLNPKQFASYRESYTAANSKSDQTDARLMARMLRERITLLRVWRPDDEKTRLLGRLCEQRRKLVDEHTRARQQLISQLKAYFPQVLELFGDVKKEALLLDILWRWPDPRQLKRADRKLIVKILNQNNVKDPEKQKEITDRLRSMLLLTKDVAVLEPSIHLCQTMVKVLKVYNDSVEALETKIDQLMKTHPDAKLFSSLRGAGKALAPRLLTLFGSDRQRWANADEIASFSGIAPVTKQSGKSKSVHRRFACPKFLRQTFHEFADHARRWCTWSKAVYAYLREEKNMKHHAALRKIARSWIRILFKVWKTRKPFDPERYLTQLLNKRPELIKYISKSNRPKTT